VQLRGTEIMNIAGRSSSGSAAKAASDAMRDWWLGTKEGEWVSMAVFSEGNKYGIDNDLVYSFPCTC